MKRVLKYGLAFIGGILCLLTLIFFMCYLPIVQNIVKNKVLDYIEKQYELKAEVGYFRIGFPFDLRLENVFAGKSETDTLVALKHLYIKIGIKDIWQQRLTVENCSVDELKFAFVNDSTDLQLIGHLKEFDLLIREIDLRKKQINIDRIFLTDGEVNFTSGAVADEVEEEKNDAIGWEIGVNEINLNHVAFAMSSETMPSLRTGMERGRIAKGNLNLGNRSIIVDSLYVGEVWCGMVLAADSTLNESDLPTISTVSENEPWHIRLNSFGMDNSAFSMKQQGLQDMQIALSGIGVRIDSIYNSGEQVYASLKDMQAVYSDGLVLRSLYGDVAMDSSLTALDGGYIRTANSQLFLEVRMNDQVKNIGGTVPLGCSISGILGVADLIPFYKKIPQEIENKHLNINTVFSISNQSLQLERLLLEMPAHFRVEGNGELTEYLDKRKMKGNVRLDGELSDISFLNEYLSETGINVPTDMAFSSKFKVGDMKGDLLFDLLCGNGELSVEGSYGWGPCLYEGCVAMKEFPLQLFFPSDSIGLLSAEINVKGQSFDWRQAKACLEMQLDRLDYKMHSYEDINLSALIEKMKLNGALRSKDSMAPFELVFKADSIADKYNLSLGGYIGSVDLYQLHFTEKPLCVELGVDMNLRLNGEDDMNLDIRLDSVRMSNSMVDYVLGDVGLSAETSCRETKLNLSSGDLNIAFAMDSSLQKLKHSMNEVIAVIEKQMADRNVNMMEISEVLPSFNIKIEGKEQNLISHILKTQNVGFRHLNFEMTCREHSGMRLGMMLNKPYVNHVSLDSIQLGIWQTGQGLMYSLLTNSSSDSWKGLFNISAMGRVRGKYFRMELKQQDVLGHIGFDMGINTELKDSTLLLSFFPVNPILGFQRWTVNEDNYVEVGKNGNINANLLMKCEEKSVLMKSLPDMGSQTERLQAIITGLDLEEISSMLPFSPQLAGELNTNLLMHTENRRVGMEGEIGINEFEYEKQKIGSLKLGIDYNVDKHFTEHLIDLNLGLDSVCCTSVKGTVSTQKNKEDLSVDIGINSFPLYVANAFLPADIMKLHGELNGNLKLSGMLKSPDLSGALFFRKAKADVVMLGTNLSLDTSLLEVKNGQILFDDYRFVASNDSKMLLNGSLTLLPFERMGMNLDINARDFELVNVKKNKTSLIYGKAYADIQTKLKGAFADLNIEGKVNLLNRTDITYTLRTMDPALVDRSEDLVRFVSFRDTVIDEQVPSVSKLHADGFGMKMFVEIGNQVRVGVNLSEDGNDQVKIQGGGSLILAVKPESGMTLSGKYILTGGIVDYNVPIVGKKEFSIQKGSFVEWTGELMNPLLSIAASEQVKADVEDNEQTRQVVFESIIRIQNNLLKPDITFDLAAPNDMVIQNQLATFSPEERTRQALNLLIYNTYTAPGATTSSAANAKVANNAIYSFVENELNKYTRKAGLTVGFDSHNTEENLTRTDLTYQFSHQLFNERVRVKIGGRISTDDNDGGQGSLQDNLVDDISIEYVLTKKRNLYAKVFRHSNYESVLDGEVIQTGAGFVWRKSFRKFKDLFRKKDKYE